MHIPSEEDIRALRRDKFQDNPEADLTKDLERLAVGEPLAYVIGWLPFLGLTLHLDSHPLIPRPETEWWTEKLIAHLKEKLADQPFAFLDLCAGSGAIGLAVLAQFPHAQVSFVELEHAHCELIRRNIDANNLDVARAHIYEGNLFTAPEPGTQNARFDIIATNPPYIPADRTLPESVRDFEPHEALFSGADGLDLMRRIATEAKEHLNPGGELWVECDASHATEAEALFRAAGGRNVTLHNDQYDRPRLLLSYW